MRVVRFDQWMEEALYDPERGYYRSGRDPFGAHGDFFTASQLQPLFGRVITAEARAIAPDRPVFELGPGRREMGAYFHPTYTGIEIGEPLPDDLSGFVFANEFFDALPVRAGTKRGGALRELLVASGLRGARWEVGLELESGALDFVHRYWPYIREGDRFEIGLTALEWMDRITSRVRCGHLLIVDYGFTTAETIRFPQGTLMSYRNHAATPDVLRDPGKQDITAHVAWDALRDRAQSLGWECRRFETLAQLTMRNLEREPSLAEGREAQKHLRTVLFGVGETFRCLLLEKKTATKKNGPDCSGPSRT